MEQNIDYISGIKEAIPGLNVKIQEPMKKHTTFAIGGPADVFISPKDTGELTKILACLRKKEVPFFVLGNGSNMLVSDKGIRGAVVYTGEMDKVQEIGENLIAAEAGALLSRIARRAQRAGLSGAEFAGGIPGSLGGAVFMNAGAYDGQMKLIVKKTEYIDENGTLCEMEGDSHEFEYRTSVFKKHPDWTIVRSELKLEAKDPAEILDKMNDFSQRRREKQPLNYPSAGSTFKRPTGYFAGQLIEEANLKGASVGAAQVSEKHAGFLINRGGATAEDMLKLIELVQKTVFEKFGVTLECEVRLVGE